MTLPLAFSPHLHLPLGPTPSFPFDLSFVPSPSRRPALGAMSNYEPTNYAASPQCSPSKAYFSSIGFDQPTDDWAHSTWSPAASEAWTGEWEPFVDFEHLHAPAPKLSPPAARPSSPIDFSVFLDS